MIEEIYNGKKFLYILRDKWLYLTRYRRKVEGEKQDCYDLWWRSPEGKFYPTFPGFIHRIGRPADAGGLVQEKRQEENKRRSESMKGNKNKKRNSIWNDVAATIN